MNDFGEQKIFVPAGIRTPDRQSMASRYTNCAIPAHFNSLVCLVNWKMPTQMHGVFGQSVCYICPFLTKFAFDQELLAKMSKTICPVKAEFLHVDRRTEVTKRTLALLEVSRRRPKIFKTKMRSGMPFFTVITRCSNTCICLWDDVVSLVTRKCAGRSRVRFPSDATFFISPKRPQRPWGRPSLLFNGYRQFEVAGVLDLTTHLHRMPKVRMGEATPLLPTSCLYGMDKYSVAPTSVPHRRPVAPCLFIRPPWLVSWPTLSM